MKRLMVAAFCLGTLAGCAFLDDQIGSAEKPGPVSRFVDGVERVASGTPVGAVAALLAGLFGVYQKTRSKKYAEALQGVVIGVDRALEHGVNVSVEKRELYNKIREGIGEVAGDVAFVENLIASIKAKERAA